MKYNKKRRYPLKSRKNAATSIQRAWRNRKRKKLGLNTRTTLANRRAIKQIKKNVETKMIERVEASVATNWGGQWLSPRAVDSNGYFAGVVGTPGAVVRPFYGLPQGVESNNRVGSKVTVHSLTYKINMIAGNGETNRVGCYIVLDRQPANPLAPSLRGLPAPQVTDTFLESGPQASGIIPMQFQNMDNVTGPSARYKLLRHHHCRVARTIAGQITGGPLKPSQNFTGTLKLPYKLFYQADDDASPENQEVLFMFYSDSGVAPHPSVELRCRFRYKDA